MRGRFERLISLIEPLRRDNFGEWGVDKEHEGTLDDPIYFPFPVYSDAVNELIDAIYEIERKYPEYNLQRYGEVLSLHGIE